jgi:hypothetical protein
MEEHSGEKGVGYRWHVDDKPGVIDEVEAEECYHADQRPDGNFTRISALYPNFINTSFLLVHHKVSNG